MELTWYQKVKQRLLRPMESDVPGYRYLLCGSDGQTTSIRGKLGTLAEAAQLAKTAQWVLSYPIKVWCREGQEEPDLSTPPTGIIEDPALPTKAAVVAEPTKTLAEDASDLKVDFASAKAAELADTLNLTTTDFAGIKASGKTGYTRVDVEKAAKAREDAE